VYVILVGKSAGIRQFQKPIKPLKIWYSTMASGAYFVPLFREETKLKMGFQQQWTVFIAVWLT